VSGFFTLPTPVSYPGQARKNKSGAPQGINYDRIIDYILSRPGERITQKEICDHFGWSSPWCSRIMGNDAFRERLYLRKVEIVDPQLMATVETMMEDIVLEAQKALLKEIQRPQPSMPAVLKALEIGSRHLTEYRKAEAMQVQQEVQSTLDERIQGIAEKMDSLFSPKFIERVIDAEVTEVVEGGEAVPQRGIQDQDAGQVQGSGPVLDESV
jgi:hypothetical protein